MKNVFLAFLLLGATILFAQEEIKQKILTISRVEKAPKIDGNLNDAAWVNAAIAKDFVMFRPSSGLKEPDNIRTEVKIVYDDEAIYFGAYLYDDKVEEIPMEFQTRDNFGNADFFIVAINPANDGINQTEFAVMSTGNQNDARATINGEDWSWNAVWDSSVKVVADGWIVEMKIPYSALRFSNEKIQTWSMNIHRQHRKNRDQYSWNFINREKGNIGLYDGIIKGIENIEPPVRLSVNPFVFGAINDFAGQTEFDWSAGMDLKYGLSENFTLDATLIPDFGQVAFDDLTLNLGPFEQQFSDKRAFFTEGTDLFTKGDFFYSRRVGSSPIGRDFSTNASEIILDNPSKVNLLNAIKVSGRTKKGLGIGVFNAITNKTKASVKNTIDNTIREIVTEPFANYNVLVLDQQFNKNSSVSLVNTNVMRQGDFRDANVTGLLFNLSTKENTYGISGGVGMSTVFKNQQTTTGLEGKFDFKKISGLHRFGAGFNFRNAKYDQTDLGFQRRNNNMSFDTNYSYQIIEPTKLLNSYRFSINTSLNYLMKLDKTTASYLSKPNLFTDNRIGFRFNATTKKQLSFGFRLNTAIGPLYDYNEPRLANRFIKNAPYIGSGYFLSTDYSKKFAIDHDFYLGHRLDKERDFYSIGLSPRYRINDRITLIYKLNYRQTNNLKAYVSNSGDDVFIGNRDSKSVTNSISTKYNFSTKAALGLSFRHFWSPVTYDSQFFLLENDGTLSQNAYSNNHDINFNIWNVDLSYNWEFAPGSQLVALYRNQIFNVDNQSQLNFNENLDNLFQQDQLHNFSLKLIYFLDYNKAKSWI